MGKKVFTNIVWMLTTGVYCALGAAVYFLWSPCCSLFKYFFVLSYHVSVTFWVQCCVVYSGLIYVICVCLRIVVSTYIVLCFSSSCEPYVASFSGLSMFDCLFGILWRLFMVKISIHQCFFFSSFKAILFFECICIYFRSDVWWRAMDTGCCLVSFYGHVILDT
jgi:hypothetical protein